MKIVERINLKNYSKSKAILFLFTMSLCISFLIIEAIGQYSEYSSVNGNCKVGKCVNGDGKMTWEDGTSYIGCFKNGKMHGKGTMTYADGIKYVGQWKDDMREGQGTETNYADGKLVYKYIGHWENDKKNGKGTLLFIYSNVAERDHEIYGVKFVGQFYNNETESGTLIYSDGRKYIGTVHWDCPYGRGTMTYPNGKKINGEWYNCQLVKDSQNDIETCSNFFYEHTTSSNTCSELCKRYFPNDQNCKSNCCDCYRLLSKPGDEPCR